MFARAAPGYAGLDARCEHELHIGMFALDDHMATRATMTLGLPDRIAW